MIDTLSKILYSKWPTYPIYTDNIEQNFKPGTFFIRMLSIQTTGIISNRRHTAETYNISYWPVNDNVEVMEMGGDLMSLFETFTYGSSKLHGQGMTFNVVDTVGHLIITLYSYKDIESEELDNMKKVTVGVKL